MTASCLSCHQSVITDDGLRCQFHDNASVRAGYVCLSWIGKGGQGSFYGSCFDERRESQQDQPGVDRRGLFGVVAKFHDAERSMSGSYVIPGLSPTVGLSDHE